MNKALLIVIIIGGILVISEIIYWLSISSNNPVKNQEIKFIDNDIDFYYTSLGNNVMIIGVENTDILRNLLVNYYKSEDNLIYGVVRGKNALLELINLSYENNFTVFVQSTFQDLIYNTTINFYIPYQNLEGKYIKIKGGLVYINNGLYTKDGRSIENNIDIKSYIGLDIFLLEEILNTRNIYVFSFENRTKLEKYQNATISDRCLLNTTVNYKKDYVERIEIDSIYVKRDFSNISRIYEDYPVVYCEESYVDYYVEDADYTKQLYKVKLTNSNGIKYVKFVDSINSSYQLQVNYKISGNTIIDYEIE